MNYLMMMMKERQKDQELKTEERTTRIGAVEESLIMMVPLATSTETIWVLILFLGSEFAAQFRISRPWFCRLMEDAMASKHPFFTKTESIVGNSVSSIEAKLLLPLKTYTYGVAPKCFCDYFQMSFPFAATVCKEFDEMMVSLYTKEYLRTPTPTPNDIKSIVTLHKHVHGVDGHMNPNIHHRLCQEYHLLSSHLALRISLFCNRHCRGEFSFGSTCRIDFYSSFFSPNFPCMGRKIILVLSD
jgi:hypothetical protein